MRNRTPKRAKQETEYRKKKKKYLEANPFCLAQLEVCTGLSVDVHHKKGRCGELLTNEELFLAVCRECHNEIEKSPLMAKEKGLSLSRLATQQQ